MAVETQGMNPVQKAGLKDSPKYRIRSTFTLQFNSRVLEDGPPHKESIKRLQRRDRHYALAGGGFSGVLLGKCSAMSIHIKKSGFVLSEWNPDIQDYQEEDFIPMRHMRYGVTEIEDGVTVGDIILFVCRDKFLKEFFTEYSSCPIDEFATAVEYTVPKPGTLLHCEVSAHCEVSTGRHPKYKVLSDREIEFSLDFHGVGPIDSDEPWDGGKKSGEIINNWSISELPIEELSPLPIKLTKNSSMQHHDSLMDEYGKVDLGDLDHCPSLLDFLDCILYDISFSGGIAQREAFSEHIEELAKGVKEGTIETVPFDLSNKEVVN